MSSQSIKQRIERFLFFPESDYWISVLRIGLGLQLICFCFALRKDWTHLFATNEGGLIGRDLMEAALNAESSFIPRVGWLTEIAHQAGVSESSALWICWACLLVSGLLLLIGMLSRTAAITGWFVHLCAVKTVGLLSYGVDNLTTVGLFYLMIGPLPDRWSFDSIIRGCSPNSDLISFFRRILQVHICLIYFFSGFSKLAGTGWWDGTNLWRALTMPPFNFVDSQLVLRFKMFLPAAGLGICLLEFCYPVFIWHRTTRKIWLAGICLMHLMIGLTMGMFLFAFIMIILNLAAFFPFKRTIVRAPTNASPEADSAPVPASLC